ncbi:MAG: TolC family protein [bacterium]
MKNYLKWGIFILFIFTGPLPKIYTQSLSLPKAVKEAVNNNLSLSQAYQEWKAKKARFWANISPDYPTIFTEMEGIPENSPSLDQFQVKKSGISQEFEFPTAYFFKAQQSRNLQKKAKARYQQLRNEVVAEVKKGFYKFQLFNKQQDLYEKILSLTRENFEKARIRVIAGETTSYDTLKLRVDVTEAENQVVKIQNQKKITQAELNKILGREIERPLVLQGELHHKPLNINLDSLRSTALIAHPRLNSARKEISLKKTERNLAWNDLLPGLHLRYFKQEFGNNSTKKAWGAEIGLSLPLWSFLKGQGEIRAANNTLNAARTNEISVKQSILVEMDIAIAALKIAEKKVNSFQKNTLNQVEELVRITTRSYEEGEMGYLQLADALKTMHRIKAEYYHSIYQYLKARAELLLAAGIPPEL